jgi:hypothetical protein
MIKNWNLFKESVNSERKIHKICERYNIKKYTINDDLSIDVDDRVYLSINNLRVIPLRFRRVSGNFSCENNKLTSLIGSPEFLDGYFSCYKNNLTSLEYLPKYIGGGINCQYNKIWNFRGIPDSFKREFYCEGNPIFNIWKLFESSGDIEFLNDCHALREPETPDGLPIVILERLNYFLETIGKDPVEKVDGYINI